MFIKIKESDKQIEVMMLQALAKDLYFTLSRALPKAKPRIDNMIKDVFMTNDTYMSLEYGTLVGEFGFPKDSTARLEAILNQIINSMEIELSQFQVTKNLKIKGGLKIKVLVASFKDILKLPEASVITDKKKKLPWLYWLLRMGNKYIISDYAIMFKNSGRSGMAIMVKNQHSDWKVPAQYAGTAKDNWLTRAIDSRIGYIESAMCTILEDEIQKAIR